MTANMPTRNGGAPTSMGTLLLEEGGFKRIDISTPRHPDTFVLVDACDYEMLNQWKWTPLKLRHTTYAYRRMRVNGRPKKVYMHRQILAAPVGFEVDHRDLNGLNNQRSNLRLCSHAQNNSNKRKRKRGKTSQFIGVYKRTGTRYYVAQITCNLINRYLGIFDNENDAARAYNLAAKELHGEFASLNLIPEDNPELTKSPRGS